MFVFLIAVLIGALLVKFGALTVLAAVLALGIKAAILVILVLAVLLIWSVFFR